MDVELGDQYEDLPEEQERVIMQANAFFNKTKLGPAVLKHLLTKTKNPKFKEAIEILMPHMDKHGSDLHHGNWMVRLTSVGPQLVIIDPFVASSYANLD